MKRIRYLNERDLALFKRACMIIAGSEQSSIVRRYAMQKVLEYISEGWAWSGNDKSIDELTKLVESWSKK